MNDLRLSNVSSVRDFSSPEGEEEGIKIREIPFELFRDSMSKHLHSDPTDLPMNTGRSIVLHILDTVREVSEEGNALVLAWQQRAWKEVFAMMDSEAISEEVKRQIVLESLRENDLTVFAALIKHVVISDEFQQVILETVSERNRIAVIRFLICNGGVSERNRLLQVKRAIVNGEVKTLKLFYGKYEKFVGIEDEWIFMAISKGYLNVIEFFLHDTLIVEKVIARVLLGDKLGNLHLIQFLLELDKVSVDVINASFGSAVLEDRLDVIYALKKTGKVLISTLKDATKEAVLREHFGLIPFFDECVGIPQKCIDRLIVAASSRGACHCIEYFAKKGKISEEIKIAAYDAALRCNAKLADCLKEIKNTKESRACILS